MKFEFELSNQYIHKIYIFCLYITFKKSRYNIYKKLHFCNIQYSLQDRVLLDTNIKRTYYSRRWTKFILQCT